MAGILRKIMPVVPPSSSNSSTKCGDDNENVVHNVEYSLAIEYSGPVCDNIPLVLPIVVDQIPIAAAQVVSSSLLSDSSLTVVQPLVKHTSIEKKQPREPKLSSKYSNGACVSGESSTRVDNSDAVGCATDADCKLKAFDGVESSSKLECLDGLDNSSESFDCTSRDDCMSMVSDLIGGSGKLESSQCCDDSDTVHEESVCSEAESNDVRPKTERIGKKGSCYRCLKGNRFTEKEACIVCGAKYCCHCVLRAMGSMPEGRKCFTCIGFRINKAKRGNLGKGSRMLKRLLTDMEIKQIMKSEISCVVNKLPPQHVYVNGEPLSQNQLLILQGCPNPPKKLTPGQYWYDRVSGLWGKDGHKPCQIISAQLEVGGQLMENASNGNTNVYINNRQITKSELKMLKIAGEQCEGNPHFWLTADGSYQEEGQNHIKGRIWDKAKLVFNVPFSEDEHQNIKLIIQSNLYRYIAVLLEGGERFEEESLAEKWKRVIDPSGSSGPSDQKTMYSIGQRLKAFSDWLLKVMVPGNLEAIFPAAIRAYAPFVEELWKDAAFQATYERRNELEMLPRIATYFLERSVEISRPGYEPSDIDILYAEGITSSNGLSCMEFSFPNSTQESIVDSSDQNDSLFRYQLIRVHPKSLGENCKWLEMFEDVDVVLFCCSLIEYDEFVEDINGNLTNKMLLSKQLFQSIVTHPRFNNKDFLLLLNKYDLLEEKIEQVPLSKCEWFHDFNPVISHNHQCNSRRNSRTSLAQYAFHYIGAKFKTLFRSFSARNKLFVSQVTALEPDSVKEALSYAKEILKWDDEEHNYTHPEGSSYTDFEQTSSS